MFREKYKAAFVNIKADHAQIDKIFDEGKTTHQKTKNKIIPFRYAGTLAAAVAIVVVVALYPNFSGFLGTEQQEFDPVGVVGYSLDKTWDNTSISSGASTKGTNLSEDKASAKQSETKEPSSKTNFKNQQTEASNAPAVAMRSADLNDAIAEYDLEQSQEQKDMMKSSGNATLVEGMSYSLVNGSVSVLVYSEHEEIETLLINNATDLLIVSEELAYAKIDGKFYEITALGLTIEEFSKFISKEFY